MPLLRTLPILFRLALTGLLAALLIGMVASAQHLKWHYENRDERKGLSTDDVRAAYHGLESPAPLLTALQRGHPASLPADGRAVLIRWVQSGRINEDYENIDLGASSPREIIAAGCLGCHSAAAADTAGAGLRLAQPEDVRKVAFSRSVQPNSDKVVVMSMHAHALSMATMSVVLVGLLWLTRFPRTAAGLLAALNGLALPADLAAWWLAREHAPFVNVIVGAGVAYNATFGLMLVLVLLDLWWPRRNPAGSSARG